jgi:membrane protein
MGLQGLLARVQPRAIGRRSALLALRALREYSADHCSQLAAAISYHVLFSIFPMVVLTVAVVGLVVGEDTVRHDVIANVVDTLPLTPTGRTQVVELVNGVRGGGASVVGLIGLLVLLWSASGMMGAIRAGINQAWDVDRRRPFVRGKLMDLALLAFSAVAIGAAAGVTIVGRVIRHSGADLPAAVAAFAPFVNAASGVVAVLVTISLLFGAVLLMYVVVPAVPTSVRTVWPGALFAAVGVQALQFGFGVYVANFSHYNQVYGSLGAVIALLFFIYLASNVFLLGAEIASEYPQLPETVSDDDLPHPARWARHRWDRLRR